MICMVTPGHICNSIWDMLGHRHRNTYNKLGGEAINPNAYSDMMLASCQTAINIRDICDCAVQVNDGRTVELVYEGRRYYA